MSKIKNLWSDRSNQYQYAKWFVQYAKPYMGRITVMMMFNLLIYGGRTCHGHP